MLEPRHFSYKCPLQLADLDRVNGGYHCNQCQKQIHDLTDCSLDEVRELQQRHGSLCGFVRLVGVTSLLSLAACTKSENPVEHSGGGNIEPPKPPENERVLMGDVAAPEIKPTPQAPSRTAEIPKETSDIPITPEKETPAETKEPKQIEVPPPAIMGMIAPLPDPKPVAPNPPV